MVNLKINGQQVQVESGTTILEAAKELGIEVPSLCYDPRLEANESCGICLVEVEGEINLPKACSTQVEDGMNVWTESKNVVEARKEILEDILSTHPMDCLTCPKSGICKLQDLCYKYDVKEPAYVVERGKQEIDDSNEFYYSDPDKCISCEKCMQVCEQLQCISALEKVERGNDVYISPPYGKKLEDSDCVSCGNCVSVCPVGALMPKSKEKFRYWETKEVKTTCSYCGVGCQLSLLVKDNKIVDVKPEDGISNNGLLCVKGKFAFDFVNHEDRLTKPLIRKNGKLEEATWDEALDLVAEKIGEAKEKHGPDSVAAFSSARGLTEDNYMMTKLMRAAVGTNNVDHCARL